ncbi:hypothetical protein [Xanthomonas citri]|uniref:hypothetical protein n=1 Tax=Xanthomonas citri TaxID=346 RepID=UPI00103D8142|nr:hypothetical protein [Xanthomonas citri]
MFLIPSFRKHKSEEETAADRRFLDALQQKKALRIVDGTVYVEASKVEERMDAFRKAARRMTKR